MNSSPRHLFGSPAAPLSPSLCPGAPPDLLRLPLWCGGWQAIFGASLMYGFPAVPECGMEVVFVSCRRLLKYIIKEMYMTGPCPCHRSPTGQQVAANLVDLCEL